MPRSAQRARIHHRHLARALESARAGAPGIIGEGELYCDYPDCPVRTVRLHFKEFPGERRLTAALRCPACRRQLKCHDIWDIHDDRHQERDDLG